ncbi:MAG: WecB/TagA/CpsF family glycosyltransferase, partial [Thiothrix sp.]
SLFLLGGYNHANALAVQKLQQRYGIRVGGFAPAYQAYPFSEEHNQAIRAQLQQFRPDYLFVAFGAVKQERWIADNLAFLRALGVRLVVGCGGTFDFVAGTIKRAPRWLQRSGLEGLWRLTNEPSLFRLRRLLLSMRFFAVFYRYHIATIVRDSKSG